MCIIPFVDLCNYVYKKFNVFHLTHNQLSSQNHMKYILILTHLIWRIWIDLKYNVYSHHFVHFPWDCVYFNCFSINVKSWPLLKDRTSFSVNYVQILWNTIVTFVMLTFALPALYNTWRTRQTDMKLSSSSTEKKDPFCQSATPIRKTDVKCIAKIAVNPRVFCVL